MLLSSDQNQRYNCSQSQQTQWHMLGCVLNYQEITIVFCRGNRGRITLKQNTLYFDVKLVNRSQRCRAKKGRGLGQVEWQPVSSLSPFTNLRTGSTLLPRPFTSWRPGTGDSNSGCLGYCIQSVPPHFHNQFIRVVHQVNYSTKQGRNELGIVCLSLLTERVHERDCSLGCKNNLSHENTQRIWVKLHLKDAFCLSQNNKKFYPSHAGDRILRGCHEFIHNGPDSSVIFNRQH